MFLFLVLFSLKSFSQETSLIKMDGSSTVYPIAEAMAEEFQTANRNKAKFAIGVSGTGGGFKKFCRGETTIQNASRPIDKTELQSCKKNSIEFVEFPIAFDGVVVVTHKSNPIEEITIEQLKNIWQPSSKNQAISWKSIDQKFSSDKIQLFGAGSDSGTFDFFTEMVVGKAKESRSDYTSSEDDNILVKAISNNKNALGYLPYAYYEKNKSTLKSLAIRFNGKSVLPSIATVKSGEYKPLSRPLFMYVNKKSLDSEVLTNYLNFFFKNADLIIKQVNYVPLTQKGYLYASTKIKNKTSGTEFLDHSQIANLMNKIVF